MKKNTNWILTITFLAFFITIFFSLGAQILLKDVNIFLGIIIILVFIIIGVIFDVIGVAVQSSDTVPFHAMASKKVKSAKTAKKMLENSAKVSSFCNDVIGDICNIISGSAVTVVAATIAMKLNLDDTIPTLLVTSLVASITIGGKAIGKGFALNNSEYIISQVTKVMHFFKKGK